MEDSGRGTAVGPSNPIPNYESLSSPLEGSDEEARKLLSKLAASANFTPSPLMLAQQVAAYLYSQETAMTSLSLLSPPSPIPTFRTSTTDTDTLSLPRPAPPSKP